ncbi:Hypothetical protein D9617_11g009120 [Elsinoe fawcettii]|nr:Hypothetical protein D9617_11g009120 [Elsinoe fawcettii]
MTKPNTSSPSCSNPVVRAYRATYHFFGFTKAYNFPLYVLTIGALFGFSLARLSYLNVSGTFSQASIPGEWFWLRLTRRRVGITMHLIGVLFGSLLAVHQFTPALRHRFPLAHRIVGHFAILLFLLGNVGAFMIIDHSVGGSPAMKTWIGLVGAMTTLSIILAYTNIRRLQIDQHRAWMIRTWGWAASIITLRLILGLGMVSTFTTGVEFMTQFRCDEVFFMYTNLGVPDAGNPVPRLYPACGPDAKTSLTQILVSSTGDGPESSAARLRPLFIMAAWLAIAIHVGLVELYLHLTPAESHRLRVVSRERQLARGMITEEDIKGAGLGAGRTGDAPEWWSREVQVVGKEQRRESEATMALSDDEELKKETV